MKRISLYLVAIVMFSLCFSLSSAFADEDYLLINYDGSCLKVERVGYKFNTWGKNDIEAVQWDRIVIGSDGKAEIYLEVYGYGAHKLTAFETPGGTMVFYGSANGIPCGTKFQIYACVWKGKKKVKKNWALGPNEPRPSVAAFTGVQVVKSNKTYVFQTSCCYNNGTCQ